MPELPEVHTTATILNKLTKNRVITDVLTDYGGVIHKGKDNIKNQIFFKRFKKLVIGTSVTSVSRRAKNVLINLSNDMTILIHMKMTGHLLYGRYQSLGHPMSKWEAIENSPLKDPYNRFIHFVMTLDNDHHITLCDMRKFAKVTLIKTNELEQSIHLAGTGPEPTHHSFTFPVFKERLMRRPKGMIKQVLMDPTIIAGIGNIYSDEILWASSVHPEESPRHIPEARLRDMFISTKALLAKGINFGGDSMSDYRNPYGLPGEFQLHHEAYRRTNKACGKKGCKGIITRKIVATRSAHFCSVHQRLQNKKVQSPRKKRSS